MDNRYVMFGQLSGGAFLKKPSSTTWVYGSTNKRQQLPPTFRLWDSPVKNQLSKSTCVAHALASAVEILQHYDTGSREIISTSWFYGYRDATHYQEEGMYISEALEMARKIGGVPKTLMPDNLGYQESRNIIWQMEDVCLKSAVKYRIKNYAEISKKDIMRGIYENISPVIIGMEIYESFLSVNSTGILPVPKKTEKYYGGHAVLCTGWTTINNDIYLVIKNSWGEGWGDNGYAYMKLSDEMPIYEMYIIYDETNHPLELTDISGHWCEEDIKLAVRCGILGGYEDQTYKPNNYITRAEMGAIIARLLRKTAMY